MGRIIAGRARGARLEAPRGSRTRPTTDRVREALFSAVVSWFDGADAESDEQLSRLAVADLFAGSGAVALEAASRGASPVVAVERDRDAARLIARNASRTGLDVSVRAVSAASWLATQEAAGLDLVFADPPYETSAGELGGLLRALAAPGVVAPGGLVVLEHSSRGDRPTWPKEFVERWERRYGETVLSYASRGGVR